MDASGAVIIGAGKIGRGFLAHLLYVDRIPFAFVEQNPALVAGLRRQGGYRIEIMGRPDRSVRVTGFQVWGWEDAEAASACATVSTIFTAVGGSRLPEVGRRLAPLLAGRWHRRPDAAVNVVTCENWVRPGAVLREHIERALPAAWRERSRDLLGVAEATVLRSCMEPTPEEAARDPWTVRAQDYWQLQLDQEALVAPLPQAAGLRPEPRFARALERKLYTYNAASATLAFLGVFRGYRYLHEAAQDADIDRIVRQVLDESGTAVCRRYGYRPEDQRRFAQQALDKYANPEILDPLERNVRDPLRKLGPNDRLVGPARLCLEVGLAPRALALATAAGLSYREPTDPAAVALAAVVRQRGLDGALAEVCGLDPAGPLARLVRERMADVDRFSRGEPVG